MALTAPADASTWADPFPTAVATPEPSTVRTDGSELVHETCVVTVCPLASRTVARKVRVWPMKSIVEDWGDREIDAGPDGVVGPPPSSPPPQAANASVPRRAAGAAILEILIASVPCFSE